MAVLRREEVKLTPAEIRAGQLFRAACDDWLALHIKAEAPAFVVPTTSGIFRHLCSARSHRSTGLQLNTKAISSISVIEIADRWRWEGAAAWAAQGVVANFQFEWKEGKCARCGATAITSPGRFVVVQP